VNIQRKMPGRPKKGVGIPAKTRILSYAAYYFLEAGYDATSIDIVAKGADVAKASVYHHFHEKSKLFIDSIVYILSEANTKIKEVLAKDTTFNQKILEAAKSLLSMEHKVLSYDLVLNQAKAKFDSERAQSIENAAREFETTIVSAFETAKANGELRFNDPVFAATLFLGMVRAAHLNMQKYAEKEVTQVAENVAKAYLYGMSSLQ
jgi:AcrR family transcriptional regulator